jgi:hypothetical protein
MSHTSEVTAEIHGFSEAGATPTPSRIAAMSSSSLKRRPLRRLPQPRLLWRPLVGSSPASRYETGTREPRVSIAVRLAAAVSSTVESIWPSGNVEREDVA